MGTFNYTHQCQCPDASVLFTVVRGDAAAWKADAASGGHVSTCGVCGCTYRTVDDGVDVGSGGGLAIRNESRAQIDSLTTATSGPIAGGTTVRIAGHAFLHTAPAVTFAGAAAASTTIIDNDTLEVTTPPGSVRLNLDGTLFTRLDHGSVAGGPFQVGETVEAGTSGITGEVMVAGATYLLVNNVSQLTFSIGETLTGLTSGATAVLNATSVPAFQVGEPVNGVTSGETGVVSQASPLRVRLLSGALTPGEEVFGHINGARVKLDDTTPSDGFVDVEISNAWGHHSTSSVLSAAFEYTV